MKKGSTDTRYLKEAEMAVLLKDIKKHNMTDPLTAFSVLEAPLMWSMFGFHISSTFL